MPSLNANVKKSGADRYAVSAIIMKGGKILLLKRHATDHFAGMYEFPGGGVEESETLEDAVAREVQEEAGMHITSIIRYVGSLKGEMEGKVLKRFTFLVDVQDRENVKLSYEHEDYIWAGRSEVAKVKLTDWTEKTLNQFWS